jgi:hypothetical protein
VSFDIAVTRVFQDENPRTNGDLASVVRGRGTGNNECKVALKAASTSWAVCHSDERPPQSRSYTILGLAAKHCDVPLTFAAHTWFDLI